MTATRVVRWRDWTGAGIEHVVLSEDDDGIVAESALLGTTESGTVFAVRYPDRLRRRLASPGARDLHSG